MHRGLAHKPRKPRKPRKPGIAGGAVEGGIAGVGLPPPPTSGFHGRKPDSTPWNTAYQSSLADIAKRRIDSDAGAEYDTAAANKDFGINDDSNPFSRMANLRKRHTIANRGINTGMAAQGQLYSGAYNNAVDSERMQDADMRNTAQSDYDAAIRGIADRKAANNAALDTDTTNASIDNIRWANSDEETLKMQGEEIQPDGEAGKPVVKNGNFYYYYPNRPKESRYVYIRPAKRKKKK